MAAEVGFRGFGGQVKKKTVASTATSLLCAQQQAGGFYKKLDEVDTLMGKVGR